MSATEFTVKCNNCNGEVNGWTQTIKYTLQPKTAIQAGQTIYLSCGCVVDFPEWKIDLTSGECKIVDFYGRVFIEFIDEEMLMEDDE